MVKSELAVVLALFINAPKAVDSSFWDIYEGRVKDIIGQVLILLTYNDLLPEIGSVYLYLVKLIATCEDVQAALIFIPELLIRIFEYQFLLRVFVQ
jgi:hypothetical protein